MTKHTPQVAAQQEEVRRQVGEMLSRSASFQALSRDEQNKIREGTTAIVDTMVQNKLRQTSRGQGGEDPFAVPMFTQGGTVGPPPLPGQGGMQQQPQFTGGATQPGAKANFGPASTKDFGAGIAMGVAQTGQLLREVNFPAFVAELVRGVFQAVVDASIQQMRAYGELVQSVTMSLNDFRDQNVSSNQGRDHLVSKYPTLMQVNITDQGPRVGPRPGWDDQDLPNFREELGTDEDISDLDPETIEQYLVPAARNDLAKQRQSLLATMMLMGINRIVVTDGKINAKLKFDFRASDAQTTYAQTWDYANMGTTTVTQRTQESSEETGEGYSESRGWLSSNRSGESSRWSKGTEQITQAPVILLKGQEDVQTDAQVSAEGQLRGEVSLNFKSETFNLNQLASADEIFKLERVRSAGRGTPAPGAPAQGTTGQTSTATPPAQSTPPASTPPASTPPATTTPNTGG
jgi:hypothetical protein